MKRKSACLLLAVLLAVSFLLWKLFAGAAATNPTILPPPPTDIAPAVNFTDTRLLKLVNRAHAMHGEPAQLVPAFPTVPVRESSIALHPAALEALQAMFAQAKTEGIQGLYLSSGYRDFETQQRLFQEMQDQSHVMPPGHSEHHSGLAADILVLEVEMARMGRSKQGRWLAENAWRWGFILRYPEGKQNITGIAYEPWHFRYIGLPHAWYCHTHTLVLEEYIQFLRESGGYRVTLEGKAYTVLYSAAKDGILSGYSVSSDNTGGYIMTGWG